MDLLGDTYLSDILHMISQDILVPVVVLLLFFIVYSAFEIGSLIAETLTTHRSFKVVMPEFLSSLQCAKMDEVPDVVAKSGMLNRQKVALLTLWDYRTLDDEAYIALAKRLLTNENLRYQRISGRTDAATKLSPMLGLMGTLIPLGPGITAMGQGDLTQLSSSLSIAFDTTVAGLLAAFLCYIVSRIRKNRYKGYVSALESSMTTMIEKVRNMRESEGVGIDKPGHSARDYSEALGKHVKDEQIARRIAENTSQDKAESKDKPFDLNHSSTLSASMSSVTAETGRQ